MHRHSTGRVLVRNCAHGAIALGAMWAWAAAYGAELEEVVVTAQKRAQPLQDVPISVSVLSGEAAASRSLSDLSALGTQVPGVQFAPSDQGGGNTDFYIRGIGQNDFISTNDPGVGVYVDGVFIARTAGGLLDLTDIDRVEVLRGPQGTLFGKNTVGGAISVYNKQPTFKTEGNVFIRAGERSRLDGGVTLNIPVIDNQLAIRFSAVEKSQDGFGRSLETGRLYGGEGKQIARLAALWLPTDGVQVDFSVDYTRVRQPIKFSIIPTINPDTFVTQPQNQWAAANGVAPYDARWISPSLYTNYSVFPQTDHEDTYGANLTIAWSLGAGAQLKSITAYRNSKIDTGLAFSAAPSQIGDQTVHEKDDQLSQEFILSGKAIGQRLDWVAGLYYLKENIYSDIYLPLSFAANPDGYDTDSTNSGTNTSYAAYGQGTYQITDKLGVVLGARYSSDKKTDTIHVYANKFFVDLLPPTPLDHSWSSLTYRAGLQYQFAPRALGYLSIATGFKGGGFNGRAQSTTFIAFDPERATTYEAGIKSEVLDRRLRLNAAAFQTNYKDIQTTLNVVDPVTQVTTNVVANPADARIKGLELDAEALVTDSLAFTLGATATSAHYVSLVPGTDVSLSDHLPQVPAVTWNAGLKLDLPVSTGLANDGVFGARIDVSYKASWYDGAPNSQYNFEPALTLVNARIAYGPKSQKWSVAAYARNLTNKQYYLYHEDLMAFVYSIADPAPPREIGGEVSFRW
jgi:iron complex outermembrane receptor protein